MYDLPGKRIRAVMYNFLQVNGHDLSNNRYVSHHDNGQEFM